MMLNLEPGEGTDLHSSSSSVDFLEWYATNSHEKDRLVECHVIIEDSILLCLVIIYYIKTLNIDLHKCTLL